MAGVAAVAVVINIASLGLIAAWGIAAGMALGPAVAFVVMYVFVRFIKKEKLFDYAILKLD